MLHYVLIGTIVRSNLKALFQKLEVFKKTGLITVDEYIENRDMLVNKA